MMRNPDGMGEDEYDGCGDLVRIYLKVRDGRVAEVRFQTYGCGPTIAAASAGSELTTGLGVEKILDLSADAVEAALDGLPEERRHAAEIVAGALQAAARDYLRRQGERVGPTGGAQHV
jgi:nitrogen fixation NifU-like protein